MSVPLPRSTDGRPGIPTGRADAVAEGYARGPAAVEERSMTEPALDGDPRGPSMLDDLYPADAQFRRSMRSYVVLLALAGLIAAFGLYQDSVASIIGAMVVAPLGGAIMAFAGALVTGRESMALDHVPAGRPRRPDGHRHRRPRVLDPARPDRPHAVARRPYGAGTAGPRGRAGRRRRRRVRGGRPDRQRRAPGRGHRRVPRPAPGDGRDLPGTRPSRRRGRGDAPVRHELLGHRRRGVHRLHPVRGRAQPRDAPRAASAPKRVPRGHPRARA